MPVADPGGMRAVLRGACGELGAVSKRREVHLDEVADPGWFLELEVVLSERQGP